MRSRAWVLSCCGMPWDLHRSRRTQKAKAGKYGLQAFWERQVSASCYSIPPRSGRYDDGLATYENFVEEYMTENDAIIGPYTHTIFLNVYHPELHYYTIAYKLYSLPFVNTEALSSYSQLDTYDNLWYICFQGGYPNEMEDEYSYEQVLEFHYMYYDFAIFRPGEAWRKSSTVMDE